MPVTQDVCKRLLYAKYLLSRARAAQTEQNELGMAVSLLLMHDASELLMLAILDHLGSSSVNWKFMDFWEKAKLKSGKEPGHKIPMSRLNDLRVSLKHKGTLPRAQDVRDLTPRVETFCEETTKQLLDLDFSELSLAVLIADANVRSTLQDAEKALKAGDKNSAYVNVRVAFEKLRRLMTSDVALINKPRGIKVPKGTLPKETYQTLLNLQGVVFDLAGIVNMLMIGIDPVKYRFLLANTPAVSLTLSGDHQALITRDYNDVTDEVFRPAFDLSLTWP